MIGTVGSGGDKGGGRRGPAGFGGRGGSSAARTHRLCAGAHGVKGGLSQGPGMGRCSRHPARMAGAAGQGPCACSGCMLH